MKPELIGKKYDKLADWWHEKHKNAAYGLKQIDRALRYCPETGKQALDVGCGSGGRIIRKLTDAGYSITGLDVSEKMIRIARREHPDVHFERTDICTWKSGKKFDLIIAWDSIFHLPAKSQKPVVSRLCGLLNRNGILIYTFGDDYGDHNSLSFSDGKGGQYGDLENDEFGYGTIGITGNLQVLHKNGCKCMHLEIDQYPPGHVYLIAKKIK